MLLLPMWFQETRMMDILKKGLLPQGRQLMTWPKGHHCHQIKKVCNSIDSGERILFTWNTLTFVDKTMVALSFIHLFTYLLSSKSRRPWSQTVKDIIENHFKDFLKEMKISGKLDCQRCLTENQTLRDNGRDWKAVKYFVHNRITSKKKNWSHKYGI